MRKLYFILMFNLIFNSVSGQDFLFTDNSNNQKSDFIQLDSFCVNGVKFYSNKQEMMAGFGQPDSIVNPKYDCGGFSEHWQRETFLQYFYGSIQFIGSNDSFQIERIDVQINDSIYLEYKGSEINNKTNVFVFQELFPISFENRHIKNNDSGIENITMTPTVSSDDRVIFRFKNGILISMEYRSSC